MNYSCLGSEMEYSGVSRWVEKGQLRNEHSGQLTIPPFNLNSKPCR